MHSLQISDLYQSFLYLNVFFEHFFSGVSLRILSADSDGLSNGVLTSALEWDYYDPCYVKQNNLPKHKHHRPAMHTKQYWVWNFPAVSISSFNIYFYYLLYSYFKCFVLKRHIFLTSHHYAFTLISIAKFDNECTLPQNLFQLQNIWFTLHLNC